MIEAFERHLRTHNISKQFEEAKTKEDKIEVCKKFLESEGLTVRPKLDAEKQMQEGERYSMVANPLVLKGQGGAGGGGAGHGKIDPNSLSILGGDLVWSNVSLGSISAGNIVANHIKQPKYFQVHYRLSEGLEMSFQDPKNVQLHVMNELMNELSEGLKKFVIQNNLIKSEIDHSNNDKHYTIKVGFTE